MWNTLQSLHFSQLDNASKMPTRTEHVQNIDQIPRYQETAQKTLKKLGSTTVATNYLQYLLVNV